MNYLEEINRIVDKYELPKLKFNIDEGLPPILSYQQMDYHYNQHHKAYVNKLNMFIEKSPFKKMPLKNIIFESAKSDQSTKVFNNAAQHFNHSFFWECLRPNKMEDTRGAENLMNQIKKDFGSFDEFKKQFSENSVELFGSGWTWLVWNTNTKKLSIWKGKNAETPWMMNNWEPILCLDVWEHAYYVDYGPRRNDYVNDMWKVIHWKFCGEIFDSFNK